MPPVSNTDPVDPTSPITDNNVMKRRVTVSPILVAICLAAQPGAADQNRIDFFEKFRLLYRRRGRRDRTA